MKRYNCTVGDRRGEFGLCMEKSREGKFVTYEDHKNAVDRLKEDLKKAKSKSGNDTPKSTCGADV